MKEFHVCGLGNAIVDIFLALSEEELELLHFEKGTMRLVDSAEQQGILAHFQDHEPRLVSGGSVANSVIALSQLGGKAAFIGCVGDDRYGLHYHREFEQFDIDIGNPVIVGETTGTCVCIITPDAERTMRTCLGVSSHLAARHVDAERIRKSEWLFIEGYVFANPDTGQGAIKEAVRIAKENGTKIAVTCSEAFVVHVFGEALFEILRQADLLFCNASEAMALANTDSAESAFAKLRDVIPAAVVTDGPSGAFIRFGGQEVKAPAFACEPKDLTGAGDMFAGSFLYGITHGYSPGVAGKAANYMAMKVISQVGARYHHGAREAWELGLTM